VIVSSRYHLSVLALWIGAVVRTTVLLALSDGRCRPRFSWRMSSEAVDRSHRRAARIHSLVDKLQRARLLPAG
jgi:hypothetical protein